MIIYNYDFKNYFTQKFVFEKILLDIFKVQEIRRKSNINFLFFQNWRSLAIFIAKYGVISAKESAHSYEKKRKSSLEARKMKLEE